jgi:hypothetical protein
LAPVLYLAIIAIAQLEIFRSIGRAQKAISWVGIFFWTLNRSTRHARYIQLSLGERYNFQRSARSCEGGKSIYSHYFFNDATFLLPFLSTIIQRFS